MSAGIKRSLHGNYEVIIMHVEIEHGSFVWVVLDQDVFDFDRWERKHI